MTVLSKPLLPYSVQPALNAFPPFPADVPQAPLLIISHAKLLDNDAGEMEKLLRASRELGFFYLDLQDDPAGQHLLSLADELLNLGAEVFALPQDVKMADNLLGPDGVPRMNGYKPYGITAVDKNGTPDQTEHYYISASDILRIGAHSPATYNGAIDRALPGALHAFTTLGLATTTRLLTQYSAALGIASGSPSHLAKLHDVSPASTTHIRLIKCPPADARVSTTTLQPHTDWGSLTLLFNVVGGLQVFVPAHLAPAPRHQEGWTYVKPLPGHAVVNLGDCLVKFSGGRLRSNVHRVCAPPGDQAQLDRYSVALFLRPDDRVVLRSRVPGEEGEGEGGGEGAREEAPTVDQWVKRRGTKIVVDDRFDDAKWEDGRGTESREARA